MFENQCNKYYSIEPSARNSLACARCGIRQIIAIPLNCSSSPNQSSLVGLPPQVDAHKLNYTITVQARCTHARLPGHPWSSSMCAPGNAGGNVYTRCTQSVRCKRAHGSHISVDGGGEGVCVCVLRGELTRPVGST